MSRALQARAHLGVHKRYHPNADDTAQRRDLAEAKIADYIERVVAEAPPLSREQLDRLALLLRGAA